MRDRGSEFRDFLAFLIIIVSLTTVDLKTFNVGDEIHYGTLVNTNLIIDIQLPCTNRGEIIIYKKNDECGYCICLEEYNLTSLCLPCNVCTHSHIHHLRTIEIHGGLKKQHHKQENSEDLKEEEEIPTSDDINEVTSIQTETSETLEPSSHGDIVTFEPFERDTVTSVKKSNFRGCHPFPENETFPNPTNPCQLCVCRENFISSESRVETAVSVKCAQKFDCFHEETPKPLQNEIPNYSPDDLNDTQKYRHGDLNETPKYPHSDLDESIEGDNLGSAVSASSETTSRLSDWKLPFTPILDPRIPYSQCHPWRNGKPFPHPWDHCQICSCHEHHTYHVNYVQIECHMRPECCNKVNKDQPISAVGPKLPTYVVDNFCRDKAVDVPFLSPHQNCYLCTCRVLQGFFVGPDCKLQSGCNPGDVRPYSEDVTLSSGLENSLKIVEEKRHEGSISLKKTHSNLILQYIKSRHKVRPPLNSDENNTFDSQTQLHKNQELNQKSNKQYTNYNLHDDDESYYYKKEEKKHGVVQDKSNYIRRDKQALSSEIRESKDVNAVTVEKKSNSGIMRVTDGARCLFEGDKYADNCSFCVCFQAEDGKLFAQCAGEHCD